MRLQTLLFRNLVFHWRANVAVLLGVVVGAAVLAGALLVGDSLRGSLRDLTLDRLGRIDHAFVSERFVPSDLASRLTKAGDLIELASPVIILRGAVVRVDADNRVRQRAGRVQIIGVDDSFWPLFNTPIRDLTEKVLPNQALIRELDAQPGDLLEVHLQRPQAVPVDSILGRRDEEDEPALTAKPFADVLPGEGPGRFTLSARQQQPMVLYVKLQQLQRALKEIVPLDEPVNALLIAARPGAEDEAGAERLQIALPSVVRPEDAGFRLRKDESGRRYLSLESGRMLVEPNVVETFQRQAKREASWDCVPTLTYLANKIAHGERFAPYATITGLDPSAGPPWGPLSLLDGQPAPALNEDEILINEWLAKDLWPDGKWNEDLHKPVITITYFVESDGPKLREESKTLKLAGVAALKGPAADRTLTPDFPGIRGTRIADWKPPFPKDQWHPEWVRKVDEDYWRQYRATPKAFIAPQAAQKFWHSRFGDYTSLRLAPHSSGSLDELETHIRRRIFASDWLPLEKLGLRIQPIKAQGIDSGATAKMFGWLFLGFSLFLIASAAMLVGLLFRLSVERRAKEIGLLYAEGFPHRTVRRLLLSEGLLLAAVGSVLGLLVAVGYAGLLLQVLNHWWADSLQISFLTLHIAATDPTFGPLPYPSLTLGFVLSVLIAGFAVWLALRGLQHVSPRGLLAGQWTADSWETNQLRRRRAVWVAGAALVAAGGLAGASFYFPKDAAPPLFFGSGAALLTVGLALLAIWLRRSRRAVRGEGTSALVRLGTHNAARFPGRSLLTAGLLASAAFLIVAVDAFRHTARSAEGQKNSGTGGFALVAETDVPLRRVPHTPEEIQGIVNERSAFWHKIDPVLRHLRWYGFRLRPGDDVSCLNLYQPQQPRILGVPEEMLQRGGFAFAALLEPSDSEQQNPWQLLNREPVKGKTEVPVFADANTAEWVLHKNLGDAWTITDDDGHDVTVRLVGLLQGSLFQSELLMSEDQFRRRFASHGGYAFFLVESPAQVRDAAKGILGSIFGPHYGMTVTRASDRLATYQAVENTYLSTFQVLGGLGLLLGTAGLAVVLLRNVWERQGELALLRALGYSRAALGWLILAENGFLVLVGLVVGVVSALIAVTPQLMDRAGQIPWLGVAALVALEILVGLLVGGLAVAAILRTPLLPALRRE
jgi:hypothetical protein